MWINNNVIEKQIAIGEDIPIGFVKGRKKKPKKIDTLITQVKKEDLINFYIIENNSYTDTLAHFNLDSRKDLRLLLTEYGIAKDKKMAAKYAKRNYDKDDYKRRGEKSSQTQKSNWVNKSEEEKEEWRLKQVQAHSTDSFKKKISEINIEYNKNLNKSIKDDRNKRRSKSCKIAWSNSALIAKQRETASINRENRFKNGQVCKTQEEQLIYDALKGSYFDTQYDILVDDRYPFYVDFYIKSMDLFIEYQGHPSHGKYPYIEGDEKSIIEANRLYGGWREQYIGTDYNKYKQAKLSNINFIRIYPHSTLEENYIFNNNKFLDIITLVYNSSHNK